MSIREDIRTGRLFLDCGTGTLLQAMGLAPGELPERWNIEHPDRIVSIHRDYYDAGSNIVCANTFGANRLKFASDELEAVISAAIANVRRAASESVNPGPKYAALDIGPLGKLLKPYGDYDYEEAISVFAETVRLGAKYGADLIFIETMNDSYETKAAVIAAKENSILPIFVSNAYGEDGKLLTGTEPAAMVAMLEGLGVDAMGSNCSFGPDKMLSVIREIAKYASVPILAKPNAGMPRKVGDRTVFDVLPGDFASQMVLMAEAGATILGGCCGTTPEYIGATRRAVENVPFAPPEYHTDTLVSSYSHAVRIGGAPVLIGERINPTGKKRFRQAIQEGDINYVLNEGIRQQNAGAHILDVNVGVPGIDEPAVLTQCVYELQSVINLPLQLDTSNPEALERAMRLYNGKAMINSVNGKQESMDAVFPLVKKYGGTVVALTLDESGIPDTAEGRIAIARRILSEAERYGIERKNIVFDTLCMSVSADTRSAMTTVDALRYIRRELGINTVLGVSNISFGLPQRDVVNAGFYQMALESGLSAAIINPFSLEMMKVYRSFMLLHGMDENCAGYIEFASAIPDQAGTVAVRSKTDMPEEPVSQLSDAIIHGLKEQAGTICGQMLETEKPLDIINGMIIPALNIVGKGFEEKTVYLPQLLMSAEAAKSAFERIKAATAGTESAKSSSLRIVIATVHGDIHDIGKNIVKLMLENYGYKVFDLGRDVPAERIVDKVLEEHADICGLSALMTTTVPAMEETIRLLREKAPFCKVVVGGAVMNEEYAAQIGADKYAADAMESVRYAEIVEKEK